MSCGWNGELPSASSTSTFNSSHNSFLEGLNHYRFTLIRKRTETINYTYNLKQLIAGDFFVIQFTTKQQSYYPCHLYNII